MRSTPFRHRRTALSLLLCATAFTAPNIYAFTLGELRVQSFIGQPLQASVPYQLSADETPPETRCLAILVGDNNLPSPSRPSIQLSETSRTIRIVSLDAINEPILGFVLQSTCNGAGFSRNYTVFLDLEPAAPALAPISAPIAPEPPPVAATTIEPPALAVVQPASPVVTKPAPTRRWPRRVVADNDTSVAELASRYYPEGSTRYQRLLNALIAANPDKIAADGSVAAGTRLRSSIPAPAKPVTQASKPGIDRLTILPENPESTQRKPAKSAEDPLVALQSKVETLADLQLKMETEITQLQQSIKQLATPVASTPASTPAAKTNTAAQHASAAATLHPATLASRLAGVPFWIWLLGGLGCAAGFSFWLGRKGRQASGYAVRQGSAAFLNSTLNTPFPAQEPAPIIAREPVSEMSIIQRNTNSGFVVEEDESDIDRAQFLLADGEVEEAIALLYKSISENERDVERWLILFHIFRERMMKTEYVQLALRFQALPPDEEDWELVSNLGRKIDHDNPLFARAPADLPAEQEHRHENIAGDGALDLLSAAAIAAAAAPPPAINLDLPELDRGTPMVFLEPDVPLTPPLLPDDVTKPGDEDDDFAKPCRY